MASEVDEGERCKFSHFSRLEFCLPLFNSDMTDVLMIPVGGSLDIEGYLQEWNDNGTRIVNFVRFFLDLGILQTPWRPTSLARMAAQQPAYTVRFHRYRRTRSPL
jgi:hypothetical protein